MLLLATMGSVQSYVVTLRPPFAVSPATESPPDLQSRYIVFLIPKNSVCVRPLLSRQHSESKFFRDAKTYHTWGGTDSGSGCIRVHGFRPGISLGL